MKTTRILSIISITPKKQSRNTNMYLTAKEEKNLLINFGDAAYIYVHSLITIAFRKNPNFTDTAISKRLGWEITKVARIRRKLEKGDELFFTKQGEISICYVGKEQVIDAKQGKIKTEHPNCPKAFAPEGYFKKDGCTLLEEVLQDTRYAHIREDLYAKRALYLRCCDEEGITPLFSKTTLKDHLASLD